MSENGGGGAAEEAKSCAVSPPLVVLPDAPRDRSIPPPLMVEVEERSAQGMSPRNMWQVYALGGFMVLRWIWARWQERSKRGGSPSSGEQPN